MDRSEIERYSVLGIPIAVTSLNGTATLINKWAEDKVGRFIGVRDVASLMVMQADESLVELSNAAAMNIPDGMPLVWIGKHRGLNVSRTCGPDLMKLMLTEKKYNNLCHYFYGGKEGVIEDLIQNMIILNPELKVAGSYCPPFRKLSDSENAEVIDSINKSRADIVWVGISSPKQDIWMYDNFKKLNCTLIGVGAAFDFHSGAVKRAPKWMQYSGLEWAYRLASEPKRLWRRYIILAPKFIIKVCMTRHG